MGGGGAENMQIHKKTDVNYSLIYTAWENK
jgi:hypothetical protein